MARDLKDRSFTQTLGGEVMGKVRSFQKKSGNPEAQPDVSRRKFITKAAIGAGAVLF